MAAKPAQARGAAGAERYRAPIKVGKRSMLIYLDRRLGDEFKIATIRQGTSMQAAVLEFIEGYVTKYGAGDAAAALKPKKRTPGKPDRD